MSNGITFTEVLIALLTVLFIGLKLTGNITWSWWWVLSPLWISALIGIVVLVIVLIIMAIAFIFGK